MTFADSAAEALAILVFTAQYNRHGATEKILRCLVPYRFALAAQERGWWIRSAIVWAKPNLMPESCTDRPTDAYEHIFLMTKAARYWYDVEAVREKKSESSLIRYNYPRFGENNKGNSDEYAIMKSAYECVTREMVEKKLYVDTTIICSVFIDSSTTPPTHREVECDTVIKLKRRDDTAITSTNR